MTTHRPMFARVYPKLAAAMERGGMAEHRRTLLAGLSGHVLDIGVGDGHNFAHYPATVTRVTALEPEARLRRAAHAAAERAHTPITVLDGRAEHLPVADQTVDAAVFALVLCTVDNPRVALDEVHRVLTPNGQLRVLEHVQADTPGMARIQRLLDTTIWPYVAGGCHTGRDTATTITRAGFTLERLDRFAFPDAARTPFSTHILGIARPSR